MSDPFNLPPTDAPSWEEAPSTGSLWGQMFGLSPILRMLTDPQAQANAQALIMALTAGVASIPRIEAKLDALLGQEHPLVRATPPRIAALSDEHRADGTGGFAASGGAPDNGPGGLAPGDRRPGGDG